MNLINYHDKIISNYQSYIQSFLNIKDPEIIAFVDGEINNKKLWPEPLVQFNPTFENGNSISKLVEDGYLHPAIDLIFSGYKLYKHQEEAILLGSQEKEFIVTSGTGSGKSLTYMATIFNKVLKMGDLAKSKVQAVVVYPMNALINSQYKEIDKFKRRYEENHQTQFPITFGQYTGQETEDERDRLRTTPPNIILTNYMMLELILTRGGKDIEIRESILNNIEFLVFDELHTYRGRQGSDVSMLIRRIKAAAQKKVVCIGTSATMVSSDTSTLLEQRKKVASIASTIFGTTIDFSQVVNEYLVKSLTMNSAPATTELKNAIRQPIGLDASAREFEKHPTARWIEDEVALEKKEGQWVRRKPQKISDIANSLAQKTDESLDNCTKHLQLLLQWANILNSDDTRSKSYLPYRLHQFIAQTGSVYTTLGDQKNREFFLNAGLYANDRNTMLFPLMFSRTSGHEFICVKLDRNEEKILPREFYDVVEEDDENSPQEGYIFIQHNEDEELIWDSDRDIPDLPETWFNPPKKNGTRSIKAERANRLPQKIFFSKDGSFSFHEQKEYEGWYMPSPLMFDPTSGAIFDSQTAEWTKLMKLGGEGRSTATTVLSFEAISQLHAFNEPTEKQKLLSFTDNRQDASLQAGHFNDFIKVGQLRAAIWKALEVTGQLDYTNIAEKVFACLNLPQDQFSKQPATFPGPKKENEDAFKDFILYRILHDLRRSWRVVLPNLEQCALLEIEYKHLSESVNDHALWQPIELLFSMTADERKLFLHQVFDFFRKSYSLSFSMLEPGIIVQNSKRIKEKLKYPWTLDESEKIEFTSNIRAEKLSSNTLNLYTESAGHLSVFGRYIKKIAWQHDIDLRNKDVYTAFLYRLFDFLCDAGWLSSKVAKSSENENIRIYQLKVDNILWKRGDGVSIKPDIIKNRSYKPVVPKPNLYFQKFYTTNFHAIKPIEGKEHTGQINAEKRKQREDDFRAGKVSALFCSPTMELGIDISDLSVVHMRNVPPSPVNYAQRSGRAGRSGQAALVLIYCSNYSSHDRHYFNNAAQMVAGTVTAPRIDLVNEELLHSHLHASILTRKSLSGLNNSIGDILITDDTERLPLRQEIIETLKLNDNDKKAIIANFKKIIEDNYFGKELKLRCPSWFNDNWIANKIDDFESAFDRALNRWRKLYKAAQSQIKSATSIIENRIYADNHDKKREAYKILRQAERQRDLLLNDMNEKGNTGGRNKDQSEFYPYRYLAAEGFLPGYNFTRLPIRAFMENEDQGGEYVSRPRFIALNEFGPQNIVYHDGSKYRVNRIILSEAETKLDKAKISPYTGYIMMNDQYNYNVDPITNEELNHGMDQYTHTDFVEMTESRAYELQRITCQEEERTRKGYDIRTYFYVDGSFDSTAEAQIKLAGEKLVHIHSIPAAKLVQVNFKWRTAQERGYALNLKNGYWQTKRQELEEGKADEVKKVKLYTSDTANALYIQPIAALGLLGGGNGIVTLMFALKRAIENYFQVESNEIGATIMGEGDHPNILIYEASEGSLGVLSQIVDNPETYKTVMKEAYELCFYDNGMETEGEVLPATYNDLLSYYNQYYHQRIDRNLIREALQRLRDANVEVIANKSFGSYDEQYQLLQASRDHNSSTEELFLKHLYSNGLKLPDEAQPKVDSLYIRPDFYYKPNVYIFCDGAPHDDVLVNDDDLKKRDTLKSSGFQVLSWHYKDPLEKFIAKRPDIFKKVK
ncbi:MAG: DEAD/DEAH box helicase [Bacteroidetes bacterium]|nr:DEAD/DEAH box helicase [Bacteroidota bacterium]